MYVESNQQNKLTNEIETDSVTENRLTAVRGVGGFEGWVEKGEYIKQKNPNKMPHKTSQSDNSMVIPRGKGGQGRQKRVKGD